MWNNTPAPGNCTVLYAIYHATCECDEYIYLLVYETFIEGQSSCFLSYPCCVTGICETVSKITSWRKNPETPPKRMRNRITHTDSIFEILGLPPGEVRGPVVVWRHPVIGKGCLVFFNRNLSVLGKAACLEDGGTRTLRLIRNYNSIMWNVSIKSLYIVAFLLAEPLYPSLPVTGSLT